MLVADPAGRAITVRRRWLPWRLRKRNIDLGDLPVDFGDVDLDLDLDLGGVVAGIVVAIAFFLFGGLLLTLAVFLSEALLLLPVLVVLLAALRVLWVIPWAIEAGNGDTILGVEKVRGWRDSSDRIRELAEAYRRGEDPFAVRRT